MTESWQELESLFHEALEREPAARAAFLAERCAGRSELQAEIESLLEARADTRGQLLDLPPSPAAADAVLPAGTRLGPYEIVEPIGAGGMGQVYSARDTRLQRTVALKVLSSALGKHAGFRERFLREAQIIAALTHPHICALHDFGSAAGVDYLVMEHVEGETLAARLAQGALPLRHALRCAAQIAEALGKAHRLGIVHRDLKPANIMLARGGVSAGSAVHTMLLDFGLAKLRLPADEDATPPRASEPPKAGLTTQGAVMGTLPYMAPEQLLGKPADPRTDIFALGAVLYEMVSGRAAFEASSDQGLASAILTGEPPPLSVATSERIPPELQRTIDRCLAKEPDERWQNAEDLASELRFIADHPTASSSGAAHGWRARWQLAVIGGPAAALAIGALIVLPGYRVEREPLPVVRFAHALPAGESLAAMPAVAISPDGRLLAFVTQRDGVNRLYLRAIDADAAALVNGSEGAEQPFFSPDGQRIGFVAAGRLKTVSVRDQSLTNVASVSNMAGATWTESGSIIFGTTNTGLFRVPASGGIPEPLTVLGENEGSHRWPTVLPGDEALMYAAGPSIGYYDGGATHIVFENLRTHERRSLIAGASYPRYLDTGYLLYSSDGVLRVRPFEWPRSTLPGPQAEFAERVATGTLNGGSSGFAVSRSGTLVLAPGRERPLTRPVWVDPVGNVSPLPMPPGRYASPKLSPDGTLLALTAARPDREIWVYDIARGTSTRLTDDGASQWPVWTPDGRRIAYASTATGQVRLLWKPADGSAAAELLASGAGYAPRAFTGDGSLLLFDDVSPVTTAIRGLVVDTRAIVPVLQAGARAAQGALSPDGRWLAYMSEESGRDEVYVQPFPGPGPRWQVSTQGGREPLWDRDGRRLFFRRGGEIWSAVVRGAEPGSTAAPFATSDPNLVASGSFVSGSWPLSYDMAPDGRLVILALEQSAENVLPNPIVIVNWSSTLARAQTANAD